ncbi:ATP-dependent helicase HrpB [Ferrimonas marina]|uniref:ATP-dependent helicase HrpB n=1 Tax=Ferrimonas marina TaxID=299255 RepID=A0A1M5ZFW7_9GAMM|nr:ATP-dependent helicase HrpB [Ferrimonas marina]SHI22783.1 ATP-dependent helicase HrpB [Ferrimonas marina]
MSNLPIAALFGSIRTALQQHNQLILQAPTGAGKSTALPLALLEWPELQGKILLLEPRRLAARMIARYLASQLGEKVGQTVGLRVRGETQVSSQTRIEVVTEGVLTRLIQADPELEGVGLILFDEVHERHLATDLALALALEVQGGLREDLRLMLMSATLEGQPLQQLMPQAPLLESEGRSYPVSVEYVAVATHQRWLNELVAQVRRQLASQEGNLLVFLPGMAEIRRAAEQLQDGLPSNVRVCPLYGQLAPAEQDAAVQPPSAGHRKVVLATNIAESSLTIEGITVVVDAGWQRRAGFNLRTGQTRLETARISRAAAAQRAGRAGRLMPGHCVRLWSEAMQQGLAEAETPEILRADLTSLVLELAAWGSDPEELAWLNPPTELALQRARDVLRQLGLLDQHDSLTRLGRRVHELGADPRQGLMLVRAAELEADNPGALQLACLLAALIEEGDPLKGRDLGADLGRRLSAAAQGRHGQMAQKWFRQLGRGARKQPAHHELAGLLLALAYPDRVAQCRDNGARYQLANGSGATLLEQDPLLGSPYLVVASMNERVGQGDALIHLAAELDPATLQAQAPHLFVSERHAQFDRKSGVLRAEQRLCLGALVIRRSALTDLEPEDHRRALLAEIRRRGLDSLPWSDRAQTLCARVALARQYLCQEAWPDLGPEALLANLEQWLAPYLDGMTRFAALAKLDLYTLLRNQVPWSLHSLLDEELPERLTVPTGSEVRLHYRADGVRLAVRVQEIYGQSDTPRLARGLLPVTLELLSPARRPLQITEDLAAFWAGSWHEVKKEMRGRYPKHLWPDDPANTQPTKRTKKFS